MYFVIDQETTFDVIKKSRITGQLKVVLAPAFHMTGKVPCTHEMSVAAVTVN